VPPLDQLSRPAWSPERKLGMIVLRLYLLVAGGLVIVKVVQLSLAH